MAAKKYLSLEEAASELGISTKELIGLREKGEIRGFADRGTWKFKGEDVEEFGRRRQADSDPDVPMLTDDGLGEQPTVIRRSALDDDDDMPRGASDSDVRLIVDPELTGGKSPMDTDSDVRLLDSGALKRRKGSDSDVKIVGSVADSDSDVRLSDSVLAKQKGKSSDSDVLLVGRGKPAKPPEESDSDVKLLPKGRGGQDTEADMGILSLPEHGSVLSDEDDLVLDDAAGMTLKAASGISLDKLIDSGISLETGDSGIALIGGSDSGKLGGSGILLSGDSGKNLGRPQGGPRSSKILGKKAEKPPAKKPVFDDSSLTLADDSHVKLSADDDMGLVLDEESGIGLATDSGIALDRALDSGISLESSDVNRTQPMLALNDDLDGTNVEVPMLSDEGSNYELKMPSGDSGDDVADTSVILFDDDEADSSEGATRLGKSLDDDEPESFDMEEGADDLDVAEDVVGEDDELDEMDVFDAGDDDFDASFDAGESHASFVAPTKTMVEAPPAEWGTGTFAMMAVSTLLLAVCGTVMYDLVRSMWAWNEPTVVTRTILDQIRTMF